MFSVGCPYRVEVRGSLSGEGELRRGVESGVIDFDIRIRGKRQSLAVRGKAWVEVYSRRGHQRLGLAGAVQPLKRPSPGRRLAARVDERTAAREIKLPAA